MKPLFEISAEYSSLIKQLEEADEITLEHEDLLNQLSGDLNQKAINVGSYIKNMQLELDSISQVIESMENRKDKLENKIYKMKEYLKSNLEKCNVKIVKSPLFDIKLRLNPPHVVIEDESLIPANFIKDKIIRHIDKSLIAQMLKIELPVPGALLKQDMSLQIS